jgi:hypothetical protein
VRASVGDVVNVEAGVGIKGSAVGIVENIASVIARSISVWVREDWERSLGRWESPVVVDVSGKVAVLMGPPKGVQGCLVEVDEVLPVLNVWIDDGLLLQGAVSDDGIVDGDTAQLVVCVIIGRNEGVGDVWDIVASIRLSSNVSRSSLKLKCLDKVPPEANELKAKLNLVGDVGLPLAVADTDRLLNPDDIGPELICQFLL